MSTLQPQSLRKHRQTLLPEAKQPPKKDYGLLTVPGNEQLPPVALKDKEKVGNLVKRRFSSRMPLQDVYDGAGPMPSLPDNAAEMISQANDSTHSFPSTTEPLPQSSHQQYQGPSSTSRDDQQRRPSRPREEPARETFEYPSFDPQRYISQQLSSATNVEISDFAEKLSAMQTSLVSEKKEAMYKNYKTFLHVGKEIAYLGTEIDTLRKYLNDLHTVTSAMKEDAETALIAEEQQHLRRQMTQGGGPSSSQTSLQLPDGSGPAAQNGNGGLGVPRQRQGSHAHRSSMIFLEEDYGKQLASLYRHVEGARQHLPNAQGRRVVKESGGWYQLNAGTWKPFQPVSLFLLNDHLLVATKKRNRHGESSGAGGGGLAPPSGGQGGQGASARLTAEQCWPLQEIEVKEMIPKNSRDPSVSNALCIKFGSVQFFYRADKPSAHADFYPRLKQVKAALKKEDGQNMRRENQARLQESMDYYAKQTPNLKSHRGLLKDYSSARKSHSRESSFDMGARSKSLRELDEMINDLDIKIAYRNFAEAVQVIDSNLKSLDDQTTSSDAETAEKMLSMSTTAAAASTANMSAGDSAALTNQVLKMKLEQRAQQLTDILLHEISQDYVSKLQIQEKIKLLISLGASDEAKKTLLESRKNLIAKRIKQVEFQGDIASYMTQIAIIYFRLIRSTVDMYNGCYPDYQNSSTIVDWAKSEVEEYILLFARQLYDVNPKDEMYKSCADVTERESEQLKQVGLDLSFMLSGIYDAVSKAK